MQATTRGRIGAVAVGVVSASVGLLPWWVTGARLPLQNLWATNTLDMPIALVPFSNYEVLTAAALFIVGAGIAGLIAGFTPALRARRWWVILGASGVQLIALVQTAIVTRAGLRDDGESALYFGVISALLALSLIVAFATAVLCSKPFGSSASVGITGRWAPPGWLIGTTLFVSFIIDWVWAWLVAFAPFQDYPTMMVVTPWVAPLGVGLAIILTGIHTTGRIVAALSSLVILWLLPAAVAATVFTLGSRAMLREWQSAIEYGLQVFREALFTPEVSLRPVVGAIVIATIGLTVRYVLGRR